MAGWTWTAGPLIFGKKWKRIEFQKEPTGHHFWSQAGPKSMTKEATLLTVYGSFVLHSYTQYITLVQVQYMFVLTVVVCQSCYVHVFVYSFVFCLLSQQNIYYARVFIYMPWQRPRTAGLRGANTTRKRHSFFFWGKQRPKGYFCRRWTRLNPIRKTEVNILSYLIVLLTVRYT